MNAYGLYRRGLNMLAIMLMLVIMAPRTPAQEPAGDRVYRIIVMDNLAYDQAQEVKKLMEGWGFLPAQIQPMGEKFRVIYGEFDNHAAAVRAKQQLTQEGIINGEILGEENPAAKSAETYCVIVQEFSDRALALETREKLERQGFGSVLVRRDDQGNRIYYQVTVGVYGTINDAQGTLSEFFRQGYQTARVAPIRGETVQGEAAVKPVPTATPKAAEPPAAPQQSASQTLSPLITQSDIWKSLSNDQRRQVLTQLKMEEELRTGNTMAAKVIDIDKRLQNLSDQVRAEIDRIKGQQEQDQKVRDKLSDLYKTAQNHIRASKEQEAIVVLKQIAELDPDNRFGWKNHAQGWIERLEGQLRGEMYPGQKEEIEAKYTKLKSHADSLSSSQDPDTIARAINVWTEIQLLDPRYSEDASRQVTKLQTRLNSLNSERETVTRKRDTQDKMIKTVLGGTILLTILMLGVVWRRGHKRHQELMRKVQEITSIRPMRELGTGETPLLDSGSGKATESDIFTPRTPKRAAAAADDMANAGDPLAGIAPAAEPEPAPAKKSFFGGLKKKKGKEEPKPEPEPAAAAAMGDLDSLFGGSSETVKAESMPEPEPAMASAPAAAEPKAVNDNFNLDDIFGAGSSGSSKTDAVSSFSPEPPTKASTPAPADDDPFAALFNNESSPATSASPAPADESAGESTSGGDNTDLLSIFDEVAGGSIDTNDQTQPGQEKIDIGGDDPFAALMGSSSPAETKHDDETEIPGIKLDEPISDSPFNFNLGASDEPINAQTQDLPAFDPMATAVSQSGNGSSGITLDFEEDKIGQPPDGWEGKYDYAELTVQADTPCRDGQQYVRFQKKEGNGKAHYRYRFADMTGTIAIEFDLCCNDKNKFLLGFYVERDGDFQQSIHTKILRSEAQTTPTIHMYGEAAPYLLGSWAHIKYLVDLDQGRINGYIDSTHVVRDLPLNPNPQMLNTLSIRDNINTTGDLMLDNIKVYKA